MAARKPKCGCGECKTCRQRASSALYYARNAATVRAKVKLYREQNIEKVREYDRKRGFRVYDRQKQVARLAVTHAIENGSLTRRPCETCGATPAEAHHDDYSKPLDVRFLCKKHHMELHRRVAA